MSTDDAKCEAIRESDTAHKADRIDDVLLAPKEASDTRSFYDKWAATYEVDLENVEGGYHNPSQVADCLARYLHDKSSRILDVACGTGLVALELRPLGYENLDGLDGSPEMLALAKKRGVYHHYFCELVGGDKMSSVEDGSYDCVVTTGSFLPGHMNASCLQTLGRAVRPGGFIFICLRESALEHSSLSDLEPRMDDLVKEGFWKMIHRGRFDNYYNNLPGLEYAFQKL